MTQAITTVPVDAKRSDWPRLVANVLNRLQNTTALAGGTAAWGSITGTLSSQTDLQNALNLKANLAGPTFTGTVTLPSTTSIGTVSATEIGYLDNVTSAIQTQIDGKQPLDATLTAWAAFNTNGLLTQTAADTFTGRTLTAGSAKISISNGSGVSGNPTVDLGSVASTDLSNSANIALLNGGQTFSADISVPAEAYGVGWNGSNEVPTKNDIYDKIEAISAGGVSDGDKGDITVSSSGTVWNIDANAVGTTEIADAAVTYAKIQDVSAASRLLGRGSAGGSGDTQEIALGGGLAMSGTTLRAGPQWCVVSRSTAQTAITTTVAITWDTDVSDPNGMHDTGSNTDRITFASAGTAIAMFSARSAASVTGQWGGVIQHNNSSDVEQETVTNETDTAGGDFVAATGIFRVAASDFLRCQCFATSSRDLDTTSRFKVLFWPD